MKLLVNSLIYITDLIVATILGAILAAVVLVVFSVAPFTAVRFIVGGILWTAICWSFILLWRLCGKIKNYNKPKK